VLYEGLLILWQNIPVCCIWCTLGQLPRLLQ